MRDHDGGVDRVIEDGNITDGVAHHPAAIQAQQDVAAALGLIEIGDRMLTASRGFPVDVAKVVVGTVIAKLVEFAAGAKHSLAMKSAERGRVMTPEGFVFAHSAQIWEDL